MNKKQEAEIATALALSAKFRVQRVIKLAGEHFFLLGPIAHMAAQTLVIKNGLRNGVEHASASVQAQRYEIGVPDRLRSGDLLHERQACWLDYTTGTKMVRAGGFAPPT